MYAQTMLAQNNNQNQYLQEPIVNFEVESLSEDIGLVMHAYMRRAHFLVHITIHDRGLLTKTQYRLGSLRTLSRSLQPLECKEVN
jgi:hypothetical protein